ncbi:hypothetical protein Tco_1336525 [Tanacetum coccineum]
MTGKGCEYKYDGQRSFKQSLSQFEEVPTLLVEQTEFLTLYEMQELLEQLANQLELGKEQEELAALAVTWNITYKQLKQTEKWDEVKTESIFKSSKSYNALSLKESSQWEPKGLAQVFSA